MIADRVCFLQHLRMKRLPLVSMLGDPTSVAAALWAARPELEIRLTTTLRAAKRLQVLGLPRHANVEWFEKYETQSLPAPSRFGFTGLCC
jgi:hypothetical protein